MEITSLVTIATQLFNDYGINALFVITIFIFIWKYGERLVNKYSDKILIQKDLEHRKSLNHRKNNITRIYSTLSKLLKECKANRAIIFEYHNGGQNLSGLQFLHVSATMEKDAINTTTINTLFQNIFLSTLPGLEDELNQKGFLHIRSLSEIEDKYPLLYQTFANNSTKELVIIPINGINNPIGFVIIGLNNIQLLTDKKINTILVSEIQQISSLLDYKNIK